MNDDRLMREIMRRTGGTVRTREELAEIVRLARRHGVLGTEASYTLEDASADALRAHHWMREGCAKLKERIRKEAGLGPDDKVYLTIPFTVEGPRFRVLHARVNGSRGGVILAGPDPYAVTDEQVKGIAQQLPNFDKSDAISRPAG